MSKNTFLFLFSICLCLLSCTKKNQSFLPGQLWYDTKGQIINAHGGGILYDKGTYYWFGEYKSDSTSVALTGVGCYSSVDLYNWKYEGIALAVSDDSLSDIVKGCILERPKVIYNQTTKQYVMAFHLEKRGCGYGSAMTGFAVSDQVTGPYTYLRAMRPNQGVYPENLSAECDFDTVVSHYEAWTNEWIDAMQKGLFAYRDLQTGQMARDMTLYVDEDGRAYHIYSSEDNLTLNIALLSDDYLSYSGRYRRVMPAGHNEAPAIFKAHGHYFMITSGCTGWTPNAARMFMADSIMGNWTALGNPCVGADAELTFKSQSTFILPVEGKTNAFIFMADRWKPEMHTQSAYVWLPICFDENNLPQLQWMDQWDLSVFEDI